MTTTRSRDREACFSCKTRKKKCDKNLPSCSYCIQKHLDCRYIPTPRRRHHRGTLHSVTTNRGLSPVPASRISHQVPLLGKADDAQTTPIIPTETTTSAPTPVYHPALVSLDGVQAEVHRLIRATGQFIDDLTGHYFRNLHINLPIISRTRFQSRILMSDTPLDPDNAVLLLTICLVSYRQHDDHNHNNNYFRQTKDNNGVTLLTRDSLYLATKSLLAQIQGSSSSSPHTPPSLPLIQANLLVVLYEYFTGRHPVALISMSTCARMACVARLQDSLVPLSSDSPRTSTTTITIATAVERAEALNTWWGIVIFERVIACEVPFAFDQPFLSTLPGGDSKLPIERAKLDHYYGNEERDGEGEQQCTVSSLTTSFPTMARSFGRAAQAICLLDRVIYGVTTTTTTTTRIPPDVRKDDVESRLRILDGLDTAIQNFLALIMSDDARAPDAYCAAVAIGIRALFTLHGHILDHLEEVPEQQQQSDDDDDDILSSGSGSGGGGYKTPEEWRRTSLAALDTITNMTVDICEGHSRGLEMGKAWIDDASPNHVCIVKVAVDYLRTRKMRRMKEGRGGGDGEGGEEEESAVDKLERYLGRIRH